jgi:hypothetical protein
MFTITFDMDYSKLGEIAKAIAAKEKSRISMAVKAAGEHLTQEWIATANSKFKHSTGSYVRGIVDGKEYPFDGDDLHYRITNRVKHAIIIEKGYEPFDQKKALQTSDKVRIGKDGKKYLVVPFQRGAPGSKTMKSMPAEVYKEASKLKPSFITGNRKEGIVKGAKDFDAAEIMKETSPDKIDRLKYQWGGKLNKLGGVELPDYDYNKGMVRFENNPNLIRTDKSAYNVVNPTGNMTSRSSYFTFRTMTEDAQGWFHPGRKPMNILGETVKRTEGKILDMIAQAAKEDLGTLFQNNP